MGRVNRLTERRVLRRAADQALALPALDRLAEPPPPHRNTTPGYAPSDRDVHTRTAGARSADDWDPGDSPAASPSAGDYTEQPSTGFWDDRPGSPVNHYTTASTITAYSPTPGVRQPFPVEDRESDSTYGRQAARDDYAEETHSPAAAAATARPHHRDLSPISPVQQPGLLLTQGTAWSGDYRLRPWYRTRRAAAAFAGAAAAIVAAGILLAAHTPSDRHQQPTIVAPQVSTTQPTPHTTAQTSMSTPPPPPAAPPPPPPPAPPPQDAPAPTWRNSVPRQTTPSDDEPPRINVSRPPISVAPKPVTPPVTAAPGQNRRGGWGW